LDELFKSANALIAIKPMFPKTKVFRRSLFYKAEGNSVSAP
jgi:hypothetical protein